MLETIAATLIDGETDFFRWWNREDRLDLYQTGLGWPLIHDDDRQLWHSRAVPEELRLCAG